MKYRTIVADPPWDYDRDNFVSYHGGWKRVEKRLPYASLSTDEIAALPVGAMAASDANLFCWTTNRYLPDVFGIVRAWGFEYRQTLTWRKTGNPSPFGGVLAPHHAEFLILGQRGKPKIRERWTGSVVEAPAVVVGHSSKPDCVLDLIERSSEPPYVELFARRARFGWDYWGDESLQTAEMGAA